MWSEASRLLLLMTVLSQSFFALVRGHLVAFSFLSAWHNENIFIVTVYCSGDASTVAGTVSPGCHFSSASFTASRNTFEGLKAGI